MNCKIKPESLRVTEGGKGAKIRRMVGNGDVEQICECLYNADLVRGCIAQVPSEFLNEVFCNSGSYSPERTRYHKKNGEPFPRKSCKYCYAAGNNGGNVLPREVNEKTRESFAIYQPKFVRIGKLSEAGHPYYWHTLSKFLDLCKEFGAHFIFPNKMLPYGIEGAAEASSVVLDIAKKRGFPNGKDLSSKLNEVGGMLMYSLGYDVLEPGAVSQGFTNKWRIEQAKKYLESGVNTSLTVVCDITSSIGDNVARGAMINEAMNTREETGINVRLLPIRLNSKKVAKIVTGKGWDEIKLRGDLDQKFFGGEFENWLNSKPYFQPRDKNRELVPRFMHPDFEKLLEDGFGFCGRIGNIEYCDKCHLPGMENIRIAFDVKELADPLPYTVIGGRRKRKKKKVVEMDSKQEFLLL